MTTEIRVKNGSKRPKRALKNEKLISEAYGGYDLTQSDS